ncbi:AAA domain-containing protein [Mycoplasma bradburyae]|uniref:AAA domain-containing protein n=1 Tax=Mycoplasma bradburyae TaxID=2963128 RepID=A0ABT5GBW3_9MOLU|nr:AAA domain-containing protein [Mycoplasma bradburyae]MDC4182090.1 AAA domain-containing protein [Mycoplasma bradburyae]UTS69836.1 AAA domain-containing protein [Mycoplasma bradburyae]
MNKFNRLNSSQSFSYQYNSVNNPSFNKKSRFYSESYSNNNYRDNNNNNHNNYGNDNGNFSDITLEIPCLNGEFLSSSDFVTNKDDEFNITRLCNISLDELNKREYNLKNIAQFQLKKYFNRFNKSQLNEKLKELQKIFESAEKYYLIKPSASVFYITAFGGEIGSKNEKYNTIIFGFEKNRQNSGNYNKGNNVSRAWLKTITFNCFTDTNLKTNKYCKQLSRVKLVNKEKTSSDFEETLKTGIFTNENKIIPFSLIFDIIQFLTNDLKNNKNNVDKNEDDIVIINKSLNKIRISSFDDLKFGNKHDNNILVLSKIKLDNEQNKNSFIIPKDIDNNDLENSIKCRINFIKSETTFNNVKLDLEKIIDATNHKISEIDSNIKDEEERLYGSHSFSNSITELSNKIDKLKEIIKDKKSLIETWEKTIKSCDKNNKQWNDELISLSKNKDRTKLTDPKNISEIENKIKQSITQKNTCQNNVVKAKEEIKNNEAKLTLFVKDRIEKREEENQCQKKVEDLKKEIEKNKETNEKIKNYLNKELKNLEEKYKYIYHIKSIQSNNKIGKRLDSSSDDDEEFDIFDIRSDLEISTNNLNTAFRKPIIDDLFAEMIMVKRFRSGCYAVKNGFSNNPFISYSLFTSNIQSRTHDHIDRELEESIINKFRLNENQKNAFRESISSNSLYFLQGPPGTGKTQCISSIVSYLALNRKNTIITSSTHEAISNCLDRIHQVYNTNPNILIYKKSNSNKIDDNQYTEEHLYIHFLNKIKAFVNHDDEKDVIAEIKQKHKKLINYFKDVKEDDYDNICRLAPFDGVDLLVKNYWGKDGLDFYSVNNYNWKTKQYDLKEYIDKEIKNFINESLDERSWNKKWERYCSKYISDPDQAFDLIDKIKDIYDEEEINKSLKMIAERYGVSFFRIYDFVTWISQNFSNKNDNNEFEDKLNTYFSENDHNKQFEKREEIKPSYSSEETKFKNYVFDNNLINVIGMTTTADLDIIIGNKRKNTLWEYPIDTTIIDEVSKSNTPEIIFKLNASNRLILCGDYKQLPPNQQISNILIDKAFDEKTMREVLNDASNQQYHDDSYDDANDSDAKFIERTERVKEIWMRISEYADKFKINLSRMNPSEIINLVLNTPLYKLSILKFQKESRVNNTNYTFLTEQHRCVEPIRDLVNNFYKGDETLVNCIDDQRKYRLLNEQKNVYLIDTSQKSEKFLADNNISDYSDYYSFDQKKVVGTKLSKIEKHLNQSPGLFNQYNAEIICILIKKLIEENKDKDLKDKIGVICLTRNQTKIVRELLSKDDLIKKYKIKVDTIDNFQGREKEIVLVDFIRAKHCKDKETNTVTVKDKKRNLDFLSSEERINVAASRAKYTLVLVGAFEYYQDDAESFKEKRLILDYHIHCQSNRQNISNKVGNIIYESN